MTTKRKNLIKIYVNDDEMEEITQAAEETGLSNSTYGRKMCLDTPINTQIDRSALAEIKKLRADVTNIGHTMKQAFSSEVDEEKLVQSLRAFDRVKAEIGRVLDNIIVEKVDIIEES